MEKAPISLRSRLPDINESQARAYIAQAASFLDRNKGFFTLERYHPKSCYYQSAEARRANAEIYAEAERHYSNLNLSAKSLLAQGGKVPPVLNGINRILEDLELILLSRRNFGFYTHYSTLANGHFVDSAKDRRRPVQLKAWGLTRSYLVTREFAPHPDCAAINAQTNIHSLAPIQERAVTAIDDAIHLFFTIDHRQITAPDDLDLGWIVPDYTVDIVKSEAWGEKQRTGGTKGTEGAIWRIQQLAEIIRKCCVEKVLAALPAGQQLAQLTLVSEVRGERALGNGKRPQFNSGKIDFGVCDIRDPNQIRKFQDNDQQVRAALERSRTWLVNTVMAALRRDTSGCLGSELFAGGRAGLNPSIYYLNPVPPT